MIQVSKRAALKQKIAGVIDDYLAAGSIPSSLSYELDYMGWPEDVVSEVLMEQYGEFPVFNDLWISHIIIRLIPTGNEDVILSKDQIAKLTKDDLIRLPYIGEDGIVALVKRFAIGLNEEAGIRIRYLSILFNEMIDPLVDFTITNDGRFSHVSHTCSYNPESSAWKFKMWWCIRNQYSTKESEKIELYHRLINLLRKPFK